MKQRNESERIERQVTAIERGNRKARNGTVTKLIGLCRQLLAEVATTRDDLRRSEETKHATEHARPDHEKSLLVVYGDGFIELYGERWQRCHVVQLPQVSPINEELCERIMLLQLPKAYHDLYWPNKIRARAHVDGCPSPFAMRQAQMVRDLIPQLQRLKDAASKQEAGKAHA